MPRPARRTAPKLVATAEREGLRFRLAVAPLTRRWETVGKLEVDERLADEEAERPSPTTRTDAGAISPFRASLHAKQQRGHVRIEPAVRRTAESLDGTNRQVLRPRFMEALQCPWSRNPNRRGRGGREPPFHGVERARFKL